MDVHGIRRQADERFGVVVDAFGFEGADGFAIEEHFHGVTLGAGDERVPILQGDVHREVLGLGSEHGLVFSGEGAGSGFHLFIDGVVEAARLGIAHGDILRSNGDTANVTGVGTFVVLVIEPDVEALGLVTHEAELHGDFQILLTGELDAVHGGVIRVLGRDADEHAVFHDAPALVVTPARTEGVRGKVIGENKAAVSAGGIRSVGRSEYDSGSQ